MPDRNRGKHPNDDKWFAPKWHAAFRDAADDLGYLLSRGYAEASALQIVGNRYRLNKRQRNAISRASCGEQAIAARQASRCEATDLRDGIVEIDGFNLLILLESALSGGFVFKGRDGLYRDISSVHGSYKRVVETENAIRLAGSVLKAMMPQAVKWYFDQPISNSGRLKTKLMEISRENDFGWQVELVFNPDKILAESENIVISSDAWILDNARQWFNLGGLLIDEHIGEANIIVV